MAPMERFIFGRLEPFDYELVARPEQEALASAVSFDNLWRARQLLERCCSEALLLERDLTLASVERRPPC